jgi:hypothetical protein
VTLLWAVQFLPAEGEPEEEPKSINLVRGSRAAAANYLVGRAAQYLGGRDGTVLCKLNEGDCDIITVTFKGRPGAPAAITELVD